MGKNRRLYPSSEVILHKIGDIGRTRFQYRQVSSLVSTLMKGGNVFRPKAAFKDFVLLGEKTKLLSKIYKILSSNVESVERVKSQREKDMAISWTEEEWVK